MKAIIFDFDGTLANTLPICIFALQSVFKEFDNTILSPEEIVAMFGPTEPDIIRRNLIHENKEQAISLFYEKYESEHSTLVKGVQEIDELLLYLKSKGMKLGIVTGKARGSLEISLRSLQMEGIFDVIITGDDVDKPKPDSEGILKVLSFLGVEEDEAMFIGDSEADILAGKEANVLTIGVQWLPEYQTKNFIEKPDRLFTQIDDYKQFLNDKYFANKILF